MEISIGKFSNLVTGLERVTSANAAQLVGPIVSTTDLHCDCYRNLRPLIGEWRLSSTHLGAVAATSFAECAEKCANLRRFETLKISPFPTFHLVLSWQKATPSISFSFYGEGGITKQRNAVRAPLFERSERIALLRQFLPTIQQHFEISVSGENLEMAAVTHPSEQLQSQLVTGAIWSERRQCNEEVSIPLEASPSLIRSFVLMTQNISTLYSWEIESIREPDLFEGIAVECFVDLHNSLERTLSQPDHIIAPDAAVSFFRSIESLTPTPIAAALDKAQFRTASFEWLMGSAMNQAPLARLTLISDRRSARLFASVEGLSSVQKQTFKSLFEA